MKKILTLVILFLVCMNIYAQKLEQGPVPDDYLIYNSMDYINKGIDKNSIRPLSYIPKNTFCNTKSELPAKYDLRDDGYIMPVRNQGDWGTCWAFSTAASIESTGMKKYSLNSLSVSPLNMANKNPYNWVDKDSGGNFCSSSAYLLHLLGPVAESANPYSYPWTSPLENYDIMGVCEKAVLIEDGYYGLVSEEIAAIKQAVYENGAMQLCYKHNSYYFNYNTNSYYAPSRPSGGHAVTIVGWDDDYSKANFKYTPAGNGAFLIKNSWDIDWGNEGYFWISYYDKGINNCCQFQFTDKNDVQYDKLYTYNDTSFTNSWNCQYGMMEFLAEDNGYINGLQLCSENGGISYKADIYVNNVLKGNMKYNFEYSGYENVLLDSNIKISKGDDIKVYIDFNADNNSEFIYVYPFEGDLFEYTPTVYDQPYCTYYSFDGKNYYSNEADGNMAAGLLISTSTVNPVSVTSVKLNQTSITIEKDETSKLIATVLPTNATDKEVTWLSSNTAVATVENGLVKGLREGKAVITVKTNDGEKTATCLVEVKNPIVNVTSIEIDPMSLSIGLGETSTLIANVFPENATNKSVTWKSSNKKIVTVSDQGIIKGIKAGTTYIWVKSVDGGYSAKCKVTVKNISVKGVELSTTTLNLVKGSTDKLTANIFPENATNKSVTWKSSNSRIATVTSQGVVKGIKAGTTYIWVKTKNGGYSAKCKVIVENISVKGVELSTTNLNLTKGSTAKLIANIFPENATNKSVTWKSSNSRIATVTSQGVVKGIKAGTTYIWVKTVDGGYSAKCIVTVK